MTTLQVSNPYEYLAKIREASWLSLAVVLVLDLLSPLLLFTQAHPLAIVFLPWIFVIGLGILLVGKQRFSDLGIIPAKIIPAILFGLGLWVIIQIIVVVSMFLLEGEINWQTISIGYLVDQLLFFAISEEIIYRGFLFPQIYLKLSQAKRASGKAFWGALFVSQAIFSFAHILHRLANHTPIQEIPFQLLLLLLSGLFFCYVYLRSQNLLAAVFVHALWNFPTILISYDALPWYVVNLIVMGAAIILLEAWQRLAIRRKRVE
jgi:membrane protease YdiL (CAAX protease family)